LRIFFKNKKIKKTLFATGNQKQKINRSNELKYTIDLLNSTDIVNCRFSKKN